jgi:hypothetical protein
MKTSRSSSSTVGPRCAALHCLWSEPPVLHVLMLQPHRGCPRLTASACARAAAIGYTGKYRQTLLLHPTEPDTTVFAIGCTVVLGKLDDP